MYINNLQFLVRKDESINQRRWIQFQGLNQKGSSVYNSCLVLQRTKQIIKKKMTFLYIDFCPTFCIHKHIPTLVSIFDGIGMLQPLPSPGRLGTYT